MHCCVHRTPNLVHPYSKPASERLQMEEEKLRGIGRQSSKEKGGKSMNKRMTLSN